MRFGLVGLGCIGLLLAVGGGCGGTSSGPVIEDTALELPGTDDAGTGEAQPQDRREGEALELAGEAEARPRGEVGETSDAVEELLDGGPAPGAFGYPCTSGMQCNSGVCVVTPDGSICTMICVDECPAGFSCALHKPSLPDEVYVCAPTHMSLCRPCHTNADCQANGVDLGERCVPHGPAGSFCGGPCGQDGDCAGGYECAQTADVAGEVVKQCVKAAGECLCAQWFVAEGAATTCYLENGWGTCVGERTCTDAGLAPCPAAEPDQEQCNGTDDDCDGLTDEDAGGSECFIANQWGACTGLFVCQDGKLACAAEEPEPESCDGQDNNCNAATDEGFPDTDLDGTKDCMETDKDGDGLADGQDNCPAVPNPAQEDFDLDGDGDACDLDDDNDLSADPADCAPLDQKVHPDAEELCNAADDDCDLLVDEGFPDSDADKLADCQDQDDDNDGHADTADCLPLDPTGFPAAAEKCDGKDNNCDEAVDEGFPDTDGDNVADCMEQDKDGDGVVDGADNCPQTPNPGQEDLDQDKLGDACDPDVDGDGVPAALDNCPLLFNPGQHDADQDALGDACDDDADGDGLQSLLDNCPVDFNPLQADLDGDGMGDVCDADDDGDNDPDAADCAPADPTVHHAAGEQCDAADNNCKLGVDEGFPDTDLDNFKDCVDPDDDGDGDPDLTDCGPLDPAINGKAQEKCNGLDDNCNALIDDGFPTVECGQGKCHHVVSSCSLGAPGWCNPYLGASPEQCNGEDDDCDGQTDEGLGTIQCGFGVCLHAVSACADGASVPCDPFEGASPEACDGQDDDCDGLVDEGLGATTCGLGKCLHKVQVCEDGQPQVCDPLEGAMPEVCNGVDDDCDGETDEQLGTQECGAGECLHAVPLCLGGKPVICNPLEGAVPEQCDGQDNDCDGVVDDGLGQTTCGLGVCEHTTANCVDGVAQECDPLVGAAVEKCNGLDDDCDGEKDEELGQTTCGLGVCEHTVQSCKDGAPQACDPLLGAGVEKCGDALDNDCDGFADDSCPGSCKAIKDAGLAAGNGWYTIDVDGAAGAGTPFEAWCDMTTDGGGWTRFFRLHAAAPNGQDPFQHEVWQCAKDADNCYAGIPAAAAVTDLLVVDTTNSEWAAWHFNAGNNVSNAVLGALKDRKKQCLVDGTAFMPYAQAVKTTYCGTGDEGGCDTFFYTDGTCNTKTKPGWGTHWDGDTCCCAAAFKMGYVDCNGGACCGCLPNDADWGFMEPCTERAGFGEMYWR